MTPPLHWPRRNPYNKRWFQVQVGLQLTADRRERIAGIVARWEPRLFAVGVNVRESLMVEQSRLAGIVERGGVDWSVFPKWVQRKGCEG